MLSPTKFKNGCTSRNIGRILGFSLQGKKRNERRFVVVLVCVTLILQSMLELRSNSKCIPCRFRVLNQHSFSFHLVVWAKSQVPPVFFRMVNSLALIPWENQDREEQALPLALRPELGVTTLDTVGPGRLLQLAYSSAGRGRESTRSGCTYTWFGPCSYFMPHRECFW